ncbi:MAG: hypothetical protein UT41_C0001G0486 [Candidatus Wolfebacteria bacterium GW2011_GWC2_39_22]|uniref:26 kDa periplasmic immunogenic protein n=1 Tax=Candidatus Wolfebacteria bacterium GW2011_GWC2_39_22 TaxID=1619013 RepID=A0A0G0RGZ3_9BACT|nr:MAG: hypothetical protein UT41_C0001G0486 [Candidatus Wolfebacteria bacterium GW2011_GWC2_39_22]HBI25404.1 hypothetical protein [Candidatus Wolfebacteria bacterium]
MTEQMDTKIKNGLWIVGALAVVTIAYSGLVYARAFSESIEPSSFRSFSVTGEGKVTAIPDVAEFSFGVVTQGDKNVSAAQKQNTEKMNAIIGFIKEQGVEDKDIKTQQFSIEPRYQYYDCSQTVIWATGGPTSAARPCPPPDIVGYTITQSALVKVRDFEKIGEIMGQLSEKGANSISQLSFTIDEPAKVEAAAREEAIKQAQDKAEATAKAASFRIGKLLNIDESGYMPVPMYRDAMGGYAKSVSLEVAQAPSIEPGSQEVTVTVSLRYEIR